MNTRFAAPVILALVGATFLAGGCVSQAQYDSVYASNLRAQEQLRNAEKVIQELRGRNSALESELTRIRIELSQERNTTRDLRNRLAALQDALRELNAKYLALAGNQIAPPDIPTVALNDELDRQLLELLEKYSDLFDYDRTKGVLRFKSDMTFARGSDEVTPRAREALGRFAKIMADPAAAPYHVYIAGHTDDIPISNPRTKERHPTNWYLSIHRAISVQEVLAKDGVAEKRIGAMGFGEWHPITPNAPGKKGNEKNRRVELWIVPPSRFFTTDDQAAAPAATVRPPTRDIAPAPMAPDDDDEDL